MRKILGVFAAVLIVMMAVPLSAQKVYRVGVIPKFIAEDYFIACERDSARPRRISAGKSKSTGSATRCPRPPRPTRRTTSRASSTRSTTRSSYRPSTPSYADTLRAA